jgi:hypothetical protein
MPITMPASTPTCKTTVLVHIIIDPIVAFPFVLVGGGAGAGRAVRCLCCDLM